MMFRRLAVRVLPTFGPLFLAAAIPDAALAADAHGAAAPRAVESSRRHPAKRAVDEGSAVSRQERERREDLERRVERLEQLYGVKEPEMPPSGPGSGSSKP